MWWEAICSAAGIIITILGTAIKIGRHIGKIQFQLDLLWDAQMRRAHAEAAIHNMTTLERTTPPSMPQFTAVAIEWYRHMAQDLSSFYRKVGRHIKDERALFQEVESRFGNTLVKEICEPRKIHAMACVLGAIAAAKQFAEEDQPQDEGSPKSEFVLKG